MILRYAFVILSTYGLVGCGVKGKPLPPLTIPPIGDGTLRAQKKATPSHPSVDSTPREEKAARPAADSL